VALTQMRLLSNLRLNRIIGTLAAELDIRRPLNFLARTPIVPAFDDELMGRFTGKIIAADIIADDQKAVVQESLTLEIISHSVPNVKIGQKLNQKLLTRIKKLEQGLYENITGEDAMRDWDMQLAENLLLAVRQRMNAMACGMMLDSFTYSRFGVQIAGASWGMPAALKVTPATAWATAATATPLNDIWALDQVARLTYGIEYDTVTMSSQNFRDMVATTEFANKASIPMQAHFLVSSAAIPTKNDPQTRKIAANILGKELVIDDTTYNERANDGTLSTTRALPQNKVLLSRKEDENSGRAYDFANGLVTESIVADMVGSGFDDITGDSYGPFAYFTPTNVDLNEPGVTAWAVARCFPRKFIPECTAVLTVG
jgi:hypothetical protein